MKKSIVISLFLSTFILGCFPLRNYDTTGFTSSGMSIYYKGEEMATLSNIEYSLDNGKLVKEMTFRLKDQKHSDVVRNLLAFIHNKHKGWEIEIDLPIENVVLDSLSVK